MNMRSVVLIAFCMNMLLSACSSSGVYSGDPQKESVIYLAEGIDNTRIQFIWLELPAQINPGSAEVRLFLAKTTPPEPTIPNPNELKCELSSENEYAILRPESLLFDFKEDGTFEGSYTYKACPTCIECYMNWDYTLNITGSISTEMIILDIAIVHVGHNVPGSFVNAELELANNNKEPRISCNRNIDCNEIEFIGR